VSKLDKALIDYEALEDPKLIDLPRGIRLLHVEATAWSVLHRTDGAISPGALHRVTDEPDAGMAAAQLVSAGVWMSTDKGWQIVDFSLSQMTSDRVRRIEEANRERQERFTHHRLGDHSKCTRCPALRTPNASSSAPTNALDDAQRLDSTRRASPSGEEEAREAASPPVALRAPASPLANVRQPSNGLTAVADIQVADVAPAAWRDLGMGTEARRRRESERRNAEREALS
jgi:hypothetical protein